MIKQAIQCESKIKQKFGPFARHNVEQNACSFSYQHQRVVFVNHTHQYRFNSILSSGDLEYLRNSIYYFVFALP